VPAAAIDLCPEKGALGLRVGGATQGMEQGPEALQPGIRGRPGYKKQEKCQMEDCSECILISRSSRFISALQLYLSSALQLYRITFHARELLLLTFLSVVYGAKRHRYPLSETLAVRTQQVSLRRPDHGLSC
jgi:hypothetical protein